MSPCEQIVEGVITLSIRNQSVVENERLYEFCRAIVIYREKLDLARNYFSGAIETGQDDEVGDWVRARNYLFGGENPIDRVRSMPAATFSSSTKVCS